ALGGAEGAVFATHKQHDWLAGAILPDREAGVAADSLDRGRGDAAGTDLLERVRSHACDLLGKLVGGGLHRRLAAVRGHDDEKHDHQPYGDNRAEDETRPLPPRLGSPTTALLPAGHPLGGRSLRTLGTGLAHGCLLAGCHGCRRCWRSGGVSTGFTWPS